MSYYDELDADELIPINADTKAIKIPTSSAEESKTPTLSELPDDVDGLIPLLSNHSSFIRRGAAIKLGDIGDNSAVQPLIDLLRREFFSEKVMFTPIIEDTAKALAKMPSIEGLQILQQILPEMISDSIYELIDPVERAKTKYVPPTTIKIIQEQIRIIYNAIYSSSSQKPKPVDTYREFDIYETRDNYFAVFRENSTGPIISYDGTSIVMLHDKIDDYYGISTKETNPEIPIKPEILSSDSEDTTQSPILQPQHKPNKNKERGIDSDIIMPVRKPNKSKERGIDSDIIMPVRKPNKSKERGIDSDISTRPEVPSSDPKNTIRPSEPQPKYTYRGTYRGFDIYETPDCFAATCKDDPTRILIAMIGESYLHDDLVVIRNKIDEYYSVDSKIEIDSEIQTKPEVPRSDPKSPTPRKDILRGILDILKKILGAL